MAFKDVKKIFGGRSKDNFSEEDYLEIDLEQEKRNNKVVVKLFMLNSYEDANFILNSIREGYTIAVIEIRNLRKKDPIELKRAISKIKKTVDALEGSIAGFGENTIIITPAFASIDKEVSKPKEEVKRKFEDF